MKQLTKKQHEILLMINELKSQDGVFPAYEKIAEKAGTSKQNINSILYDIIKKYREMNKQEETEIVENACTCILSRPPGRLFYAQKSIKY